MPDGFHRYGLIVIGNRQPQNYQENVTNFMTQIEADAKGNVIQTSVFSFSKYVNVCLACGMPMKAGGK